MNPIVHKESFREAKDQDVLHASFSHPFLFELLVERYEEAFLRKAKTIVRNEEVAKDVVQDTFVKIYLYGKGFKPIAGAQFSSWAYKVLIHTCFAWYKKTKREQEFFTAFDDDLEVIIPAQDTFESSQKIDREYLESLFGRLPETFARILRLYVIESKDYKEIATLEQVSEGAIKTRMHRARHELRKISKEITY